MVDEWAPHLYATGRLCAITKTCVLLSNYYFIHHCLLGNIVPVKSLDLLNESILINLNKRTVRYKYELFENTTQNFSSSRIPFPTPYGSMTLWIIVTGHGRNLTIHDEVVVLHDNKKPYWISSGEKFVNATITCNIDDIAVHDQITVYVKMCVIDNLRLVRNCSTIKNATQTISKL